MKIDTTCIPSIHSLSPESYKISAVFMAGLLACPVLKPSRFSTVACVSKPYLDFTATGIAPDSHRIPFSFWPIRAIGQKP
ncbi:hypothetical protein LX69_02499 [Breznakibacter xylanolyticus]|uniref:Uncharacterized protein n=1 Tax=Breznakibacter xylanolyticus TaxID=990 RepID=A0A2W7N168_9BACT|nr:hypothetical protein LX69_02499 [Breznakibacter xylanolyticus]